MLKFVQTLIVLAAISTTACKTTPVTPDQIFGAVVDCAKVNPEASAALAAVETCLVGALSSNYAACLTGLVTAGKFSIDEVACVAAWYAQQTQAKVASSTATLEELAARQRANDWLAHEEIAIRNSYPR
jgi:hypothetical protein